MPPRTRSAAGSIEEVRSTDRKDDPKIDPKKPDESVSTWIPPKTKKSELERSIGYVGAPVPAQLKHDFGKSHKRDQEVLGKGPNGSPVYDRLGYKISHKVLKGAQRRRAPRSSKKYMAFLEAEMAKSRRIKEIMGRCESKAFAWQDRVARDLDIPFHTVDLPEYEEWHRRGFRLEPGELEGKLPEEEDERLMTLAIGSAFRE